MKTPSKILAIQFKYFGDAVLMTPALRALREQFPQSQLHLLVPEEMAPLFERSPRFNRVWAIPRKRGRSSLSQTLPMIRALRGERFDGSVDFASNDRGAIVSLLIGAKERLGWDEPGGFLGRKLCYTRRVPSKPEILHESARMVHLLSGWNVPAPRSLEAEIYANPGLAEAAKIILPIESAIIFHVASSQPKKEWPIRYWAELHRLAIRAGWKVAFTTAPGEREQSLMAELLMVSPDAVILPTVAELPLFLAVLKRAAAFVSGDTGPLHFAAGLGVPTISLFGPSSPERWTPMGSTHQALTGATCACSVHAAVCQSAKHCLAAISVEQVFTCLDKAMKREKSQYGS